MSSPLAWIYLDVYYMVKVQYSLHMSEGTSSAVDLYFIIIREQFFNTGREGGGA